MSQPWGAGPPEPYPPYLPQYPYTASYPYLGGQSDPTVPQPLGPGHGPYPSIPPQNPTSYSGFAIASLMFGLLGFLGGFVLGVIFGIAALRDTRPGGQRGRGLAIAGLIASAIWFVIIGLAAALALLTAIHPPANSLSAQSLTPGQCLIELPSGGHPTKLSTTSCQRPHAAEVVGTVTIPDGPYPGKSVLGQYRNRCAAALIAYSPRGMHDQDLDLAALPPSERSWNRGDRSMVCLAIFGTKRTGSIRD